MFSAILILLAMPFTDLSRSRGTQFKPLSKAIFFVFVCNFLILMELGAKHVESPFIEFGQICTVLYFAHFLVIVPMLSLFENTLSETSIINTTNNANTLKDATSKSWPPHLELLLTGTINTPWYYIGETGDGSRCSWVRKDEMGKVISIEVPAGTAPHGNVPASSLSSKKNVVNIDEVAVNGAGNPSKFSGTGSGVNSGGSGAGKGGSSGAGNSGTSNTNARMDNSNMDNYNTDRSNMDSSHESMCDPSNVIHTLQEFINNPTKAMSILQKCITNSNFTIPKVSCLDAPKPWGMYFQDSASPQMEALVELHDNILFYLVIILFGVGWLLVSIVRKYTNTEAPISHKYIGHGTLVELIWTITPALILILIAFPSFKLLYLMDEVSDPSMAILAEGHQWYWSYQYPDFLNSDEEFIEYDSYLVPESDLENGSLRMLEVDNRLIIPELTHIRFVVTGADVIHSMACPALGIKCDAYPGRLNQTSVMTNREGTFYGQCSEICGILHSSMPIVIESVSIEKFVSWLQQQ